MADVTIGPRIQDFSYCAIVITIDTVKRHVSHIFSKLGVQNRIQAVGQARELGLLDEEL